jgi:hypothetical protein
VIFLVTETVQEARDNRQEASTFVSMHASDVYIIHCQLFFWSHSSNASHILHFKFSIIMCFHKATNNNLVIHYVNHLMKFD